ncbi:D-alanyl-D-alanine carboxypeptidase/D-alanyl-D-alanine-endopeptidase [Pseudanabaena sp. FACHB-1277]|uniref:D-alanyl-D-alanine carboxypeptidase/D-alanyl-D-alanine-endopeptidase n=1 Tax=Pseudanabaena cinerea FACHB-1277 TaxID=2949581 RepID=A0A926Z6L5_9CYAN|nr:D-alanyl-D-alanine carboxypeptidase/D-alanyl-D-alanine-endopeptidase [Pseudanabaena cinerea]MBD2150888.1 D-alanyl-D-alanine carboxypeptidase/D-alanyl-D-alanine-endopeptidase [Pseudanabaena cinerea FACHB-1277]
MSGFALKKLIFTAISLLTICAANPKDAYANNASLTQKDNINQVANQAICTEQLPKAIAQIVKTPAYQRSRIGVFVQTNQPQPRVLADFDGDRLFMIASNTKLFTTAIALHTLGANYRFTTKLRSASRPNAQGELVDGLWIEAKGDPSFKQSDLQNLVKQLKDQGVKRIQSGIWATTSRRGGEIAGSWEWQDLQEYYAAIASPFTINENSLDWQISPNQQVGKPAIFTWQDPELAKEWQVENQSITVQADAAFDLQVIRPYGKKKITITGQIPEDAPPELGAVAIPNPEVRFLELLRQELIAQGIAIPAELSRSKNNSVLASTPANQDLAVHQSAPLLELVIATNKSSNNLYAELLLRAVGDRYRQTLNTANNNYITISKDKHHEEDSDSNGMIAMQQYLQSQNIDPDDIALADGSGLSRHNLATPRAIAKLLHVIANDKMVGKYFRQSLPIAGVDGTLTRRFSNSDAKGLLQAKTGTLTGAIALSGYAQSPKYGEVIFSIMVNNAHLPNRKIQQDIDAIATLLTRLHSCN